MQNGCKDYHRHLHGPHISVGNDVMTPVIGKAEFCIAASTVLIWIGVTDCFSPFCLHSSWYCLDLIHSCPFCGFPLSQHLSQDIAVLKAQSHEPPELVSSLSRQGRGTSLLYFGKELGKEWSSNSKGWLSKHEYHSSQTPSKKEGKRGGGRGAFDMTMEVKPKIAHPLPNPY